mgnify:CR=1 FL=1
MTTPFLALLKISLKTVFSIRLPDRKELRTLKGIAKTLGWAVLALVLLADFGFLFTLMDISIHDALAPIGLQAFMLLYATVMASVIVFLFAFLTALSFFSSAPNELLFTAMPLRPVELLGARMATVYAIEAPLSLLIMGIAAVVFGIRNQPQADFYLWTIANALALPLVPLAISYFILVPIVSASRWLKRKNAILYIGGFLGLGLALGFNLYMQTMLAKIEDPVLLRAILMGQQERFADIARWWPPAWLTIKALGTELSAGSPAGASFLLSIAKGAALSLANLALGAGALGLSALVMSRAYLKIIVSFGEVSARKEQIGERESARLFAARPRLYALVLRELRLMNREPMYLLNGPFVIVLIPVILGITLIAQGKEMAEALGQLRPLLDSQVGYLIPAGIGIFLASSTSIACTSFSRDAKAIPLLKSLPLSAGDLISAKLIHALLFAAIGVVFGTLGIGLVLRISSFDLAIALVLAMLGALAINTAGLALDLFKPSLHWENPISALKQNPNAIITILFAMGVVGGLGALSVVWHAPKYVYALAYGALFAGITAGASHVLVRKGEQRFRLMEN